MSQLYTVEARASAFELSSYQKLMADKGLVQNEPVFWSVAAVPRVGDVFELGNLQIACSEVVLRVCPKQGQPVARCWFKVKP